MQLILTSLLKETLLTYLKLHSNNKKVIVIMINTKCWSNQIHYKIWKI